MLYQLLKQSVDAGKRSDSVYEVNGANLWAKTSIQRDLMRQRGIGVGSRVAIECKHPFHAAATTLAAHSLGAVTRGKSHSTSSVAADTVVRYQRRFENTEGVTNYRHCGLAIELFEPSRVWQRSQLGLFEEARSLIQHIGLNGDDRVLCAIPYEDPTGLVGGILAPIAAGAGFGHCHEEELAEAIDEFRPTVVLTSNADDLLNCPSSIRLWLTSSATRAISAKIPLRRLYSHPSCGIAFTGSALGNHSLDPLPGVQLQVVSELDSVEGGFFGNCLPYLSSVLETTRIENQPGYLRIDSTYDGRPVITSWLAVAHDGKVFLHDRGAGRQVA